MFMWNMRPMIRRVSIFDYFFPSHNFNKYIIGELKAKQASSTASISSIRASDRPSYDHMRKGYYNF